MSDLASWLQRNLSTLIQAASAELASDERLRATVEESIEAFYEALIRSTRTGSTGPLHAILIDWVEARSAPTDEELTALLPVLTTLKRVTWIQICDIAEPAEAVRLLQQVEELLTDAGNFLAALEAESVLSGLKRELGKAQMHIQRLDKSKSDFVSVAAHELKTPLTIIEGYNNMLRGSVNSDEHPEVTLMVDGIASGAGRLREIIEDMLDVSMIDNRLVNLRFQPVWLMRLVEMVEYDLREALQQRNIRLAIDQASLSNKPTYGDPERLVLVFQKVISNGIKYTPDGGTITISARELPGFTDVTIHDTGIGIAPENLTRIFDKFASLGDVATHSSGKIKFKGGGPGLGLAIAKGFIEAHGGSIWAESPGWDEKSLPGSMFHIMIPMRSAPPDDDLAVLYSPQPEIEGTNGV
jgi:signal transduction histidine kinase